MSKAIIITGKLQDAKAKKLEIVNSIEGATSEFVKGSLQKAAEEIDKEIVALEVELKAAQEYDELYNKDWDEIFKKYPNLKGYYDSTMAIGSKVSYNTAVSKLAFKRVEMGARSMLIEGKSGTGKTTFFRYAGAKLNRPVISMNASNGMTEEDILGKYTVIDGKPTFVEGPLLMAMRTGSIFVIEEINGAKPSVMLLMNSLLDDVEQVQHPANKDEMIKPAAGFLFGGTLNNGYAGTRKMNKAFVNRFNIAFQMNDMTEHSLKEIIKSKINDVTENELNVGWYVFKSLDNVIEREEYNAVVSVRQILELIKTKRLDDEHKNGTKKLSWRAAIDIAVRSQVTGFDSDMDSELDRLTEAIFNNTDKVTGLLNEKIKPMYTSLGVETAEAKEEE